MESLIREDFTDKREQFSEEELDSSTDISDTDDVIWYKFDKNENGTSTSCSDLKVQATELRERLKKLGFYRDPPTPELLREAKHVYTTLDWPRPLDEDGNPLPCPPRTAKNDILDDDDRIEELDGYAIHVPTSYINRPVQNLVEYLTEPTSSDVEKARVLTRWLGRCLEEDYIKYLPRSGTTTPGSTASYLWRLKQREIDYDELFHVLCKYADIKCKAISGCVRNTVKYEVGDDFRGQRKTWTAALLDGEWRLLDVRWICEAAYGVAKKNWRLIEDDKGKVNPRKAFKENLGSFKTQARFREYYFLTDPEIFIFDHFPDEEKWQLLARPLSYEEARDAAALRADFFRLGMSVRSHYACVCENDEGQITLVFGLEDDESVSFVYKLYQARDCKNTIAAGREKLDRYVFLERDMDEKVVRVMVRFPSEGKYLFELHGSETQETHHSILCTFMIFCTEIMEDCKPLPPNIRKEWGPSTDTKELGMTPITHRKGQVEAEDGDAQIKFGLSKDLEFRHDLIHGEKEEPLSERHVIHTVEDGKVHINLRLPKPGEYALNVLAKERNKGVAFAPACTYLVSCDDEPLQSTPFPDIVDGANLGPTEEFEKLGFSEDDPWPSYITNLVTGELNMEIKRPPDMQVYATLVFESGDKSENFNNYVICDKDRDRVMINTIFPKHGTYKLSLYARSLNGGHQDKDILIYVKVIEVMLPTLSGMPGPVQFMSDWCNDCYLKEPRKCYLPADERQKVSIVLPDAREVTIKNHPECRMKRTKDALWEGFVKTGPSGSTLEVTATPKGQQESAKILLYQVVSKEELLDIEMQQEAQFKHALDQLQRFEEEKLNRLLAKLKQAMEEKNRVKLQRYLARMQELNTGKMDDIIDQADYILQELLHEEEKIVARKELRRATRVCDIGGLESGLSKFKRLNLQSEDGDVQAAEEMLNNLLIKREKELKHKMVDEALQTPDIIQPVQQQPLQTSMQYMSPRSGVHIYVMQEPHVPTLNGFAPPDFMGSQQLKVEIRDAMSQTSEDTGVMSLNDSSNYPSGVIEPQRRPGYSSPYTSTPRKLTYSMKRDTGVGTPPPFTFQNQSPMNMEDENVEDEVEGNLGNENDEVDEFRAAEAVLKEIELSENMGKVKKLVRDNLREASVLKNEAALHKAIEDFKRLNIEEEDGDLSFAEDQLDTLQCVKRVSPSPKDKAWKAKTMNVFKNYWKRMKEESQVASESIDDEIEKEIQRLRHINQMCRKMSLAAKKIGSNWNALIKSEQSFTEILDESYDKLTEDLHNTSAMQHEVISQEEGMKNAFDHFAESADQMCAQLIAKADTVARELENSRVELLAEEILPDDFRSPDSPRHPRSPRSLIKGQGARSMSPGQSLMKTKAQIDVAKTAYYALRSNILNDMRKTNAETEDEVRKNLSDLQVMMAEFHGVGTPRSIGTLDTSSDAFPPLKL